MTDARYHLLGPIETGEETNRPHAHGFIHFNHSVIWTRVRDMLLCGSYTDGGFVHVEVVLAPTKMLKYCLKSETADNRRIFELQPENYPVG